MPLIHVYVPEGVVDTRTKAELGQRLALSLLEIEKVPDSPTARAMSWVFWHEMPEGSWVVPDGAPAGSTPIRCLVEVVAPAGLLDAGQKEATIQRLTADLLTHGSIPDTIETRLRVWIVVREVPDGSWGVAGCVAPSSMILSGLRSQ
jgi:phenylpyruvate tautomerase PptA (4-oxalocrotonate tautomerase family)